MVALYGRYNGNKWRWKPCELGFESYVSFGLIRETVNAENSKNSVNWKILFYLLHFLKKHVILSFVQLNKWKLKRWSVCGSVEIGRQARLRILWLLQSCGFKSHLPHYFFAHILLWALSGCGGTVDALDSGSSESNLVWVQISSSALIKNCCNKVKLSLSLL